MSESGKSRDRSRSVVTYSRELVCGPGGSKPNHLNAPSESEVPYPSSKTDRVRIVSTTSRRRGEGLWPIG